MPWATNTKNAHQVNQVDALTGSVNFNVLDTDQSDNSLTGGWFNSKTSQQDNILTGSGDIIGNAHTVTQNNRGFLGKRDGKGLRRRNARVSV